MTFYLYSALLLNLLPQLGFAASSTFYPGDGNSFGRPNQNATYDYVIVGGGTAGLAVAMRLAEDPSYTVAVIEAGGFYQIESGNQSVVPAYNSEFQALYDPTANPTVDWGFVTTPQSGANNRSLHYARGKTLGSSSALNANIYNRGTEAPISNGLTLATNATVPTPVNVSSDYSGGPVHISHSNFALPFTSWVNLTFASFGFKNISSFSDGELLGAQYAPAALRPDSNERETSDHLKVRTGTTDYFLSARKEVISSAGAFQSPQLLMVSGVGPAQTLAQHNISLVADRSGVGQSMWDHIDIEVTWKVGVVGFNTLPNLTFAAQQAQLFQNAPAASSIYGNYGADYIGWEKLPEPYRSNLSSTAVKDLATFPADWPEIEYEIASVYTLGIEGDYNGYGTFVIIPVSPVSRRNITLQSNSMLDPPIINPNWLTAQTDKELALQTLKREELLSLQQPCSLSSSAMKLLRVHLPRQILTKN